MRITVIGASAGVGLRTVARAREAGHTVTALSRSIDTLPAEPAVYAVAGDARNSDDVAKAIDGADAVLVALGTGRSRKPTTVYTDFARALIDAAQDRAVTAPIIAVTGFGAGGSAEYQNPVMRTAMKLLLARVYQNKTEMEELLAGSALNWEIVRPGRLTDGGRTTDYRVIVDCHPGMKVSAVSRDNVADYLVTEAEKPVNLRCYPTLTN